MQAINSIIRATKNFISTSRKKNVEGYQLGPGERIMWLVNKKKLQDKYPSGLPRQGQMDLERTEARFYGAIDPRRTNLMHLGSVDVSNFMIAPINSIQILGVTDGPLYKIKINYSDGTYRVYQGLDAGTLTELYQAAGLQVPQNLAFGDYRF